MRVRDRYPVMVEADHDNRLAGLEDLKFANEPGAQWDANMKKERGERPCYEFNKCRVNGKKVINEMRANRPQGKVRAVEGGDKETAELYEGLCRNIWNVSDGDTIVDQAAEYQVDAGMAAWRIDTEYASEDVFDQDIKLKPFKNPFCVYADPACQDVMKRDAEDWIVTERISNKAFDTRWPKAERVEFDDVEFDDDAEWEENETVRICEYWYKEPYDKEIWLVAFPQEDGTTKHVTVDSTSDEGQALAQEPGFEQYIVKRRTARCHRIMMCIVSGNAVLEGPVEWAGSMFPFVMIYGEYKIIDGRPVWHGLHRFAKDAQRSYNVSRTAIDETIALAPQAKWWATPEQAKGLTGKWAEAHKQNHPWLPYNPDPKANNGGPPQRMPGADVPIALIQQAEIAAQDIRDVTGLHEASFGEESGEKSGIALARKQNQAQIVTYNFPDNMAKGIRRTWELMIDLIPKIYDAERELRIIGADGAEDYKKVNQIVVDPQSGQAIRVNDLSMGKYDVAITVGPSFSTLRQEAAEVYGELGAKNPELMQVAGDLVFKSLDYPYAEEIAKRWQTILPPPIQQQIAEGKDLPPEAQAAMAQAAQAMQLVQQQTQLIQQAAQEVEQEKADADKKKAEINTAIANLKTEEARFEAKVAKALAGLAQKEAALSENAATREQANQQAAGQNEVQATVNELHKQFNEMMTKIAQKPQGPKRIRAKRVNGELIAEIEEPNLAG